MELHIDAHLWCLGTYAERYVPGGYFDAMSVEEQLEAMASIEGLEGLFVFYPTSPLPSAPDKLVTKLSEYGLRVSNLCPELWSDRKWRMGAFSTNETQVRQDAIKKFKEGIDFGKAIGAESILFWPAHDGFDYPFQTNYRDGWKYLVESLQELGEYDRSVKIAVEYKSKDPRQKQYVSNVGKAMMLLNDVGLDNVGGVIDVGHALMAQESLAESLEILDMHDKLFQIHLNENYKDADPDLIFGTINFWEILEFFYYLQKTEFNGWSSIDIIAPRDDRVRSLEVGVKLVRKYQALATILQKHSADIDSNAKSGGFIENIDMITDLLFSTGQK